MITRKKIPKNKRQLAEEIEEGSEYQEDELISDEDIKKIEEERRRRAELKAMHTPTKAETREQEIQEKSNYTEELQEVKDRWVETEPQTLKEVQEILGIDFIKEAIETKDYKDTVRLTDVINRAAKVFSPSMANREEYISEEEYKKSLRIAGKNVTIQQYLYTLKEILLRKSLAQAALDPNASYGWQQHKSGFARTIIYFDIPGYDQYSFHMIQGIQVKHRYKDKKSIPYEARMGNITIPKYHGKWRLEFEHNRRVNTLEESIEVWNSPPTTKSPEEIKAVLESTLLPPDTADRHELYCQAMAHPDFQKNKQEIQDLIFKDAPTIPEAGGASYTEHGEKYQPKEYEQKIIKPSDEAYWNTDSPEEKTKKLSEYLWEVIQLEPELKEEDKKEILSILQGPFKEKLSEEIKDAYEREKPQQVYRLILELEDALKVINITLQKYINDEELNEKIEYIKQEVNKNATLEEIEKYFENLTT